MLRRLIDAGRTFYVGVKRRVGYLLFDRPRGLDTAGVVRLRDIGLAASRRVDYEPSPLLALRRVLAPSDVSDADVFLDFGCGKGRVLLQAAQYPFRKVIGVELSPQLCDVARRNIEMSRAKLRCRDIELVNADVLDYAVPDEVTVAYFYNPFEGDVFEAAVDQLVDSVRRRPRTLRIVYVNPVEEKALLRAGAQCLRAPRRFWRGAHWGKGSEVRLYTLAPADIRGAAPEARAAPAHAHL